MEMQKHKGTDRDRHPERETHTKNDTHTERDTCTQKEIGADREKQYGDAEAQRYRKRWTC